MKNKFLLVFCVGLGFQTLQSAGVGQWLHKKFIYNEEAAKNAANVFLIKEINGLLIPSDNGLTFLSPDQIKEITTDENFKIYSNNLFCYFRNKSTNPSCSFDLKKGDEGLAEITFSAVGQVKFPFDCIKVITKYTETAFVQNKPALLHLSSLYQAGLASSYFTTSSVMGGVVGAGTGYVAKQCTDNWKIAAGVGVLGFGITTFKLNNWFHDAGKRGYLNAESADKSASSNGSLQ